MTTLKNFWRNHINLILATCLVLLLFGRLYQNLQPALVQTEQFYKSGRAMNLQHGMNTDTLRKIIAAGNYLTDNKDINLLVDSLPPKLMTEGRLSNLGALNKDVFLIAAPVRWRPAIGGADFEDRFHASLLKLGFDSTLYAQEISSPHAFASTIAIGSGPESISGVVAVNGAPAAGVLVQLKEHRMVPEDDTTAESFTYSRTDAAGKFSFTGLQKDSGYSVVPLKPGFEFGRRKGDAALKHAASYAFTGHPHKLRLIGAQTYSRIKDDNVFTVRTPGDFQSSFQMIVLLFIVAFWAVHIFWTVRRFSVDSFILPVLMVLTSISVVTLLGIQDPLQDTLHGWQALQGVLVGMIAVAVLSQIDFGKLYTNWKFDFLFNLKKKSFYNLQGWTWLVLAIGLAVITLLIGTGPEGSGVKVNLQFGGLVFQPSEITKYLLLLFFAAFFSANEQQLRSFPDLRWRFITSWSVMAGAGIILLLYLLMGDMGPAMVVCFTFLIFYSLASGNLLTTLLTGLCYGILLSFLPAGIATLISVIGVLLVLYFTNKIKSKSWYGWFASFVEAPLLLLMIMAAFTFGDQVPGIGDRLGDRKNMWLSPWNNDIYGGDHLAHAYWTLSSGGFSGQGLAKGFAKTMPAAHTDMILPSIGEQFGWLGLAAVFLLMALLIHRSLLHAKRAGQPFAFYLCAGIAIATGIQFLLIAGGSIGLLPLTGVTVPFLSYGKISLIINLAAFGVIAGVSARPGKEIQKEYIRKNYDPVLLSGIVGFLCGIVVLIGKLAMIQLKNGEEYIVKPARVIDRNGLPVFSYDPRINELAKIIGAGTVYDRNKLVLATSNPGQVRADFDSLSAAGISRADLNEITRKKLRRYYPFGDEMFFWVGDFNTRLFWNQPNGYFAEAEHLNTLRGFDTRPEKIDFFTSRYRADRFTQPVERNIELTAYDYSPLAKMLRSGVDSTNPEVRKLTGKNRDVVLTVDAKLQTGMQQVLAASEFQDKRISVVVMDAASGDFLASAMYPLPDLHSPETLLLSEKEKSRLKLLVSDRDMGMTYATAPGSTAKILTSMAAFKKLGLAAASVGYRDISPQEIIRGRTDGGEHEPYNTKALPVIDMHEAIVNSSNIYFIRLANDKQLDDELSNLYLTMGMNVHFMGGYSYAENKSGNSLDRRRRITQFWKDSVFSLNRHFYTDERRQGTVSRYWSEFSGVAWGQGQLTATPASMARMAGTIANRGSFQPSRYVLEKAGIAQREGERVRVVNDDTCAARLQQFMIDQSNPPGGRQKIEGIHVAGKTGTPQRKVHDIVKRDGWYVFFTPVPGRESHTVVCIRIESGDASAKAVQLANKSIAPLLKKMGYLDTF